jgi:ABC-type branched-subunit amino acid transport system substrate-binding protein
MKHYRNAGMACIASTAVTALVLVGCLSPTSAGASTTSGSVPGITKSTITIGHIADISGPIPGLMLGSQQGMQAWAAYVNSTGGIDGRKIILDDQDSALNCTNFTNEIASIAKSDFAMVGSASAADTCGLTTLKANPNFVDIPAFFVGTNYITLPNVFTAAAQPPGWRDGQYVWVKDKYGAAATKKFAALYSTVIAAEYHAQLAAATSVGYQEVYERGVGETESNFTSDILRMKSDGVEVVDLSSLTPAQDADFEQQASQQSFHPDAVIAFAYDDSLPKLLGSSSEANNMIVPLNTALYLGQDKKAIPEVATMIKWLHKTNPTATMNQYAAESWGAGLLFEQAMKTLGANPTQAGLRTAISHVTSFSGNGLYPTQNPGQKIPNGCEVITGYKNGTFARIDPATAPGFYCKGKYVLYSGS